MHTLNIEHASLNSNGLARVCSNSGCKRTLKRGVVCWDRQLDSSKSHHLFYHANCVIPSMRTDIIAGDFGHGGVTQGEIARVVRIAKEEEGN